MFASMPGLLSGVRIHPLGDKGAGLPVCSAGYWCWSNNGRLSCMMLEIPQGEGEGPNETHKKNTPINRCLPCLWKAVWEAGEEGWLFITFGSFITRWHALIVANQNTIIMRFILRLFIYFYLWYPTIKHRKWEVISPCDASTDNLDRNIEWFQLLTEKKTETHSPFTFTVNIKSG